MKKVLYLFASAIVLLIVVLVVNTLHHPFARLSATGQAPLIHAVSENSIRRFAGGLRFATVSNRDSAQVQWPVFDSFLVYLQQSYPRVFASLHDTLINKRAQVLHWPGKNSNLKPLLFMAHYDVVAPGAYEDEEHDAGQAIFNLEDTPLPPATKEATAWEYGPFSGTVTGGRIYGRGTLDMKGVLFGLLEAADSLLAQGFTPERDIYFSFGPDEEVGGLLGAAHVARHFKSRGLTFETIYDEGGIIAAPGTIKDLNQNVALIGCAEKGIVSYKIRVKGLGGHSSMPPLQTSAGMAGIIMQRLEQEQMPQRIIGPIQGFLNVAGAGMGFVSKMAIANQWLFGNILLKQLEKAPPSNALTRTTTAITMLKGSDGANVLPQETEIIVNFRILPGETSQDVLRHIEKACRGFSVQISPYRTPVEPSRLSPDNGQGYEQLKATILQQYPGVIVTPYLTIGATDCKHMGDLSDRIYRFMPVLLTEGEQRSIHNFNEYISVENYGRMIGHYYRLIQNFDSPEQKFSAAGKMK